MPEDAKIEWVVLDAMGVIYSARDDVTDILIPFLRERGCDLPDDMIVRDYKSASLGRMSSDDFWTACGMENPEGLDCELTFMHSLNPGLLQMLPKLRDNGVRLACLSNDVSEWSRLLRRRYGLERWVEKWVISGDAGRRKPDPAIYEKLLRATNAPPECCLFVDDRQKNIDAAARLGFQTLLFNESGKDAQAQFDKVLELATRD
ncbi:MAG: HAD-IA family hydrolase [Opitutales bacterium]|jgi:putative hydrolase of the HAD superfamily